MKNLIVCEVILLCYSTLFFAKKFEVHNADVQAWEIDEESYELMKLTLSDRNSIHFSSHKTFILLKIFRSQWFIFYWLGNKTTTNQKLKTVALVGELWYQIVHPSEGDLGTDSDTMDRKLLPTINRETGKSESEVFKTFFKQYSKTVTFADKRNTADLYKIVKKKKKQISIDLVPINTEQLEDKKNKNLYIFNDETIIIRDNSNRDTDLRNMENILADQLLMEKILKENILQKNIEKQEFIDHISNNIVDQEFEKSEERVHNTSMSKFMNTVFCANINTSMEKEKKILFKIISSEKDIVPVLLSVNNIDENTCYILRNRNVYCSYVYIGNKSSLNKIKYALETEEKYVNECEGSKRIIFAVKSHPLQPVAFWANFSTYTSYLTRLSYMIN